MLPCKIETRNGRQTTTPHRPKDQNVTIKGLQTSSRESQKGNLRIKFNHYVFENMKHYLLQNTINKLSQLFRQALQRQNWK
jgi:hypothetical protein